MIIVAAHRDFGANVLKELRRHTCVFRQDPISTAQRVRSTWRKVSQVSDRRCDDMQTGG
jgi:hypothetical protein